MWGRTLGLERGVEEVGVVHALRARWGAGGRGGAGGAKGEVEMEAIDDLGLGRLDLLKIDAQVRARWARR